MVVSKVFWKCEIRVSGFKDVILNDRLLGRFTDILRQQRKRDWSATRFTLRHLSQTPFGSPAAACISMVRFEDAEQSVAEDRG